MLLWCAFLFAWPSLLSAQKQVDTFPLAEPVLVFRKGLKTLPSGVERLRSIERNETLFVWIRFWEAPPEGILWRWGRDTLQAIIQVPPLPPDSLMPIADFSIPALRSEEESSESFPLALLWISAGAAVLILGLYPLLKPYIHQSLVRLWLYTRWQIWLWRWRKPAPQLFSEFIQAVKSLLRPHAESDPGSWTLTEVSTLASHTPLAEVLRALWEADYQMHFMRRGLSEAEKVNLWRSTWQTLKRLGPLSTKAILRPVSPGHHRPSAPEGAEMTLPRHASPSNG
ncbi:MAG: hypothetical protein ABDH66_06680 [Bacteroidia bacterium]